MDQAREPVGVDQEGSERDGSGIEVVDPFAVIGRASDLAPDLPPAEALPKEEVMPVVSLEELERPSKEKGNPDPLYPDIDTRDPLYIPRFLIRKWGSEKFERSAYLALWRSEAGRPVRIADPKPERKK